MRSVGSKLALSLLVIQLVCVSRSTVEATEPGTSVDLEGLRLAIEDLTRTFPREYSDGKAHLQRLEDYEKRWPQIRKASESGDEAALRELEEILAFRRRALLANPLLDFDRLLVIKRKPLGDPRRPRGEGKGLGKFLGLPQQSSWQQDEIADKINWENEIAVLSELRSAGRLRTLFKPSSSRLVGDLDLSWDARRIAFSMPDSRVAWQVYEIDADGGHLRQLTPDDPPDIHHYDPCYLPSRQIAFVSTAPLQGVPCNQTVNVAMAYRMDADGANIRQLCFDQDHNYCLTVANDGRILYLRWEYTDIPHVWGRYLFTMNPDGTSQQAFYGSGSYWPNAIFYARPIPDHPSKVVGIVTGHHVGRVGELVIFDPSQGRQSIPGVIQRIPGRGKKVEPLIQDRLTEESWPKFLHPYPLSERYFLVSAKPTPHDLWGIYLVDIFDNIVLVKELEGYALLEPVPFRTRKRPQIIPDKTDWQRKDAVVYLEDVYQGPGLQGVPHGSVRKLRLFTYHFAYQGIAGISHRVGADGPWEPKRVLGTVPVEEDGSAMFRIPANTPISMQPLDGEGKALQLMRSWATARPGEALSCTGCHEDSNGSPVSKGTIASRKEPRAIEPWHGPERGFSFKREVQPILDRHCVRCHDGSSAGAGKALPDLRGNQGRFVVLESGDPRPVSVDAASKDELFEKYGGVFEPAYFELRRFVRVGGLESDIRLLDPGEFHADTSELVQMLRKGHHGVDLDDEAWDRLVTWIDLNAPCHGTWRETAGVKKTERDHERRQELLRRYANMTGDPEAIPDLPPMTTLAAHSPPVSEPVSKTPEVASWPFTEAEARRRQAAAGNATRTIDLGRGVTMKLVLVPAGQFVMGDTSGGADERPLRVVTIEKPFWMGECEVTNEQYRRFAPTHDSRFEHKGSWVFSEQHLGWLLNGSRQPVVRVSCREAATFCSWLSERIGEGVTLPTEAQWEYACRGGSAKALSYGDLDTDFSRYANVADATIRQLAYDTDGRHTADLVPRDDRFDDGVLVTAEVGRFLPNAWGLHDMHGNVWEWTRSAYRSYGTYPAAEDDVTVSPDRPVVRGGSWRDRPVRCRSAFRLSYPSWQRVFNVGFRVVCEAEASG